jgi:hypothetical protein
MGADDDEVAYINNLTGADILASKTIELTKGYDNKVNWTVQLDYKKAAKALLEKSGLDANEREPLANIQNVIGLVKVLTEIPRPTPGQQALLDDLNRRFPSGGLLSTIDSFLYPRMPKFVYYSQYDRLPGRVSLEQLVAARQSERSTSGAKVFSPSLIGGHHRKDRPDSSTEAIASLETGENRLTKRIFKCGRRTALRFASASTRQRRGSSVARSRVPDPDLQLAAQGDDQPRTAARDSSGSSRSWCGFRRLPAPTATI